MRVVRWLGAAVVLVIFVVAGFAVGLAGSFFHDEWPEVLGIPLPVGLVVALAAEALVLWLAGMVFGNRLAVLAPAAGWLLAIFAMSAPQDEGDLVVGATGSGYTLLLGGALIIGLCLAFPYARGRAVGTGASGTAVRGVAQPGERAIR